MTDAEKARCDRCKAYVDEALHPPVTRSKDKLRPRIEALAKRRNEKPPGVTTVLGWIDVWEARGEIHGKACFWLARRRGNRDQKMGPVLIAEAVEVGVYEAFKLKKGTAADALAAAARWMKEEHPEKEVSEDDWPDVRTFQRHMRALDGVAKDSLTFGDEYAQGKYALSYERPLPELPLMEVECDHTDMDVLVVDETRRIVFGRPDLIAFRDRCTGVCMGLSISFEKASYAAFLAGLRHAIYDKRMDEHPGVNHWFASGRFKRLYVDNALHFIGNNIRLAGAHLGFEVVEFLPKEPSLKGAQERLMGLVNTQVHELPAATFSNIAQRKRYEDVAGRPVVTITELRAFVTRYICNEYNVKEREGLGHLRTLKGSPRDRWYERIEKVRKTMVPDEQDFIALAGDSAMRTVTQKGVRWDHIRYQSPGLVAILANGEHVRGRTDGERRGTRHPGTEYLVRRDPFDLARAYLTNPYAPDDPIIVLEAVRLDYAEGLTLHQHRVLIANTPKKVLERSDEPEGELLKTWNRVSEFVDLLMSDRERSGVQRKLARYLQTAERKHHRSVVKTDTESAALSLHPIDATDPAGLPPPATLSRDAAHVTPARARAPGTKAETFVDGAPLPERLDRGIAVEAARAARRARLAGSGAEEAVARPHAEPKGHRRRPAGWDDEEGSSKAPTPGGEVDAASAPAAVEPEPSEVEVPPTPDGTSGDVGATPDAPTNTPAPIASEPPPAVRVEEAVGETAPARRKPPGWE